jgi:transposase InsO family protein
MTAMASQFPIREICSVLELARSTWYYARQPRTDPRVERVVEKLAACHPTYGSRRLAKEAGRKPHQLCVNRKRAQRLLREWGLLRLPKRRTVRTTDSRHHLPRYPNLVQGLEITRPDQVWVSDVTYIRLGAEFVYLAILLDVKTRSVRGWELAPVLGAELTLPALKRALRRRRPEIHHSDQGGEYAAYAYTDELKRVGAQISMAEAGHAEQNGYAERMMRTIKEEEVNLSDYRDLADARAQIGRFLNDVYQRKRIHSSLGYLTPKEYEANWRRTHPQANDGRGGHHSAGNAGERPATRKHAPTVAVGATLHTGIKTRRCRNVIHCPPRTRR